MKTKIILIATCLTTLLGTTGCGPNFDDDQISESEYAVVGSKVTLGGRYGVCYNYYVGEAKLDTLCKKRGYKGLDKTPVIAVATAHACARNSYRQFQSNCE